MKLAVSHPGITMIRFELDKKVIPHTQQNQTYTADINDSGQIEIFFEPWKITPLVRIDDHLIDLYIANGIQYNHCVQFDWDNDFYKRYQDRIVKSKLAYLNLSTQEDIDYYLGINNNCLDIVSEIKEYL